VLNRFQYNVVFLVLSNTAYIILILTCFISVGHLADFGSTKFICVNVNVMWMWWECKPVRGRHDLVRATALFEDNMNRNHHGALFIYVSVVHQSFLYLGLTALLPDHHHVPATVSHTPFTCSSVQSCDCSMEFFELDIFAGFPPKHPYSTTEETIYRCMLAYLHV